MSPATARATPWAKPSLPAFYNPAHADQFAYSPKMPEVKDAAMDWAISRSIRPAASDKKRLHLLLIDMQRDFSFREGSLYVGGRSGRGAMDDSRRTAEFIYCNLEHISCISTTLDTHLPIQIFSRSFWEKEDGSPVTAHTVILPEDVIKGTYRPTLAAAAALGGNYGWLRDYCIHYCSELAKKGKYQLNIWPEHCLLGTDGHTLVGVIQEAAYFHAYARKTQLDLQVKGANPLTENYSILSPEVLSRQDGRPIAQKNAKFIQTLLEADYVVIGGQAASHCVKSSIDDLLAEIIDAKKPDLARKVYVLADCMSAVAVPDGKGGFYADFTPQAEDALKRFADAGMHVVKSTDPIDSWPDLVL